MALEIFEVEEDHLKIIKHLGFELRESRDMIATSYEDGSETPLGGINIIEDVGAILFGKPEGEFDPLSPYGPQYSDEQKETIERIWESTPKALEICCFVQKFEAGTYKTKWNLKNWKKYETK